MTSSLRIWILALMLPTSARALEVRLAVGQSVAEVFGEIHRALGFEHRFVDPDTRVLRPWNVRDEIVITLPEGATKAQLDALKRAVEHLRSGRTLGAAATAPDADPADPRAIAFGDTPVRLVEPPAVETSTTSRRGLAHLVVVRCPPNWSPAVCAETTHRRLIAWGVFGDRLGGSYLIDDTAVPPADRGEFNAALRQRIVNTSPGGVRTIRVRSHGPAYFDVVVKESHCARYLID